MTTATTDSPGLEQLPDDVDVLKQLVVELIAANEKLTYHQTKLEEQLAYLLRRRCGPQSEKMDPAQLQLFKQEILEALGDEPDEPEDPAPPPPKNNNRHKRSGGGRKALPAHLPRQTLTYELIDKARNCPSCGCERCCIGTKVSEQLEYVPAKLIVRQHVQHTYACRDCADQIVTAAKPTAPIPQSNAGPGLLAHVIVGKFDDHLPLYRQEEILKRNGYELNRSTMCNWVLGAAATLEPLSRRMRQLILRSRVIQTDGTGLPVLDRGRGRTRNSGFWVYRGDDRAPYVLYDYSPTQARDGPNKWLKGFSGVLQADAASLYDAFFDEKKFGTRVWEAGCWAHARRHFENAKVDDPQRALTGMAWIARLYEIEKGAKLMSHRRRRRVRRSESRAVLKGLHAWLKEIEPDALPKSATVRAVRYTLKHWEALTRYVDHGRLSIDNNASERAIRPMTVGRKNWMFAGSEEGAAATALLFGMVESAKRCGVDPWAWLHDVLERINDHPNRLLDDLLPDRWKLLRKNAAVRHVAEVAERRRRS